MGRKSDMKRNEISVEKAEKKQRIFITVECFYVFFHFKEPPHIQFSIDFVLSILLFPSKRILFLYYEKKVFNYQFPQFANASVTTSNFKMITICRKTEKVYSSMSFYFYIKRERLQFTRE
jgi:hypothetical protein